MNLTIDSRPNSYCSTTLYYTKYTAFYGGCKRDTVLILFAAAAPGVYAAAIDRCRLPTGSPAANPPHAAAAVNRWDRDTDGHHQAVT